MADLAAFKRDARAWLEDNCPLSIRQPNRTAGDTVLAGPNKQFPNKDAEVWFQRMLEKRWITPGWPAEYGGGGLSAGEAKILKREMARLKCPSPVFDQGQAYFGPVIMEYGTEAQKMQHLPPIARGDTRWCQGYSEPGAGSDLASLKTRADDKGDHFLVNGTKIWTSGADKSDWIFCLVRTDFEAPKHQGISVLLIDMNTEGISTSPIELISGKSEFCQTFLDDVKVPKENLLGELNAGWAIAKRVLQYERKLMSGEEFFSAQGPDVVATAKKYIGTDEQGKIKNHKLRSEITRHLMHNHADLLNGTRIFFSAKTEDADPNLPLIMKYSATMELKNRDELMLSILGNRGLSWDDDEFNREEQVASQSWASTKAYTIAGGTSEVQLNIIAKRALGLPSR
ncbi:MAG: acyl-CoA dehydrogenase family protein [Gammaproteobacteria bacterium]|nr:acyl-CoA dehydrogenase family protein [Gammaproteobacteria bacterium]NNM11606.1 acyl-CoA dehydrogenase [Pseudomonadales bacterium]